MQLANSSQSSDISFEDLSVSRGVLLEKVRNDLESGVKIRSGADGSDVIRVWTDTRDWQFEVLAQVLGEVKNIMRLQIKSFGQSKSYIALELSIDEGSSQLVLRKLSQSFAEFDELLLDEANEFVDSFMQSKFNRYLTSTLYEEYTENEYAEWIIND